MTRVDPAIAIEATSLVAGDRADAYGGTTDTICRLWSAYLGRPILPVDYYRLMALMKVGRSTAGYRRDSHVDAVGYLLLAEAEAPR